MTLKAQLWLLLFAVIFCALVFVGGATANFLYHLALYGWQLADHILKK